MTQNLARALTPVNLALKEIGDKGFIPNYDGNTNNLNELVEQYGVKDIPQEDLNKALSYNAHQIADELIGKPQDSVHAHLNMIIAKALNMTLVVFARDRDDAKWIEVEVNPQCISFDETLFYFLCLPQHKEVCIQWLNGITAQYWCTSNPAPQNYWLDIPRSEWKNDSPFMSTSEIRVKP